MNRMNDMSTTWAAELPFIILIDISYMLYATYIQIGNLQAKTSYWMVQVGHFIQGRGLVVLLLGLFLGIIGI